MRDVRLFRALAALLAGVSCLAAPLFVSGVLAADGHHGEAEIASAIRVAPAEAGHDACWVAEVDPHQRHDDHRFESQRGLHHHLHAGVAWSSTISVEAPGLATTQSLPRLDHATLADDELSRRAADRSPRQSRAPPRA